MVLPAAARGMLFESTSPPALALASLRKVRRSVLDGLCLLCKIVFPLYLVSGSTRAHLHMISSHSPANMFSLASGFSGWARISSSFTSTPHPGFVGMA